MDDLEQLIESIVRRLRRHAGGLEPDELRGVVSLGVVQGGEAEGKRAGWRAIHEHRAAAERRRPADPAAFPAADPADEPECRHLARRRDLTLAALRLVDPVTRRALILRLGFDGADPRTVRETAWEMGISEQSAGRILARGREAIRRFVREVEGHI